MTIDFGKGKGFTPVAPGFYILNIDSAVIGQNKTKGTDELTLKIQVLGETPEAGKTFRLWYDLTNERVYGLIRALCQAAGVRAVGGKLDERELVGKKIVGEVTINVNPKSGIENNRLSKMHRYDPEVHGSIQRQMGAIQPTTQQRPAPQPTNPPYTPQQFDPEVKPQQPIPRMNRNSGEIPF